MMRKGLHATKDGRMSHKTTLVLIWFLSSMVAAMLGLEFTHATYLDGEWHPVSNDSFYHARRILDAVDSPRGFYQFDEMIHAPEGSWLTWPWAYDWGMAQFVKAWQFFNPAMDSMEIITHVAIYWIFVNSALLATMRNPASPWRSYRSADSVRQ
jgi:asparagine N-glycosylation enzyme membrane subunit Stt3